MTNHIKFLFNGNTVVVCKQRHPEIDPEVPSFSFQDFQLSLLEKLTSPFFKIRNLIKYHTLRPPTGRKRSEYRKFLVDNNITCVLTELGNDAFFFWPIAKELNIPVFAYFRGYDATGYLEHSPRRFYKIAGYRTMCHHIDGLFAVSQFLIDELKKHDIKHPNSHVIPSGVDMAQFGETQKDPNLTIAAGRFINKKSPETSIRAFLQASKTMPASRLEMIGDGPLLNASKQLVQELGAEDKIIFHGHQSHDFVLKKLQQASLFIQHSVTASNNDKEGAPVVIQEAMSAGVAVVSTHHAGIPQLVKDGVSGHLVDEFDEEKYSNCIKDLLLDSEKCRQFGRAGRSIAMKNFDRNNLYQKLEGVIRKQVNSRSL